MIKKHELDIKIDVKNAPAIAYSVQNRLTLTHKRITNYSKITKIAIRQDYYDTKYKLEYKLDNTESPRFKIHRQIPSKIKISTPIKVKYESVSCVDISNFITA